jgi:hypothetical protein
VSESVVIGADHLVIVVDHILLKVHHLYYYTTGLPSQLYLQSIHLEI